MDRKVTGLRHVSCADTRLHLTRVGLVCRQGLSAKRGGSITLDINFSLRSGPETRSPTAGRQESTQEPACSRLPASQVLSQNRGSRLRKPPCGPACPLHAATDRAECPPGNWHPFFPIESAAVLGSTE